MEQTPPTPTLIKQPEEIRTLTFDFSGKLTDEDTLTGSPTTSVDPVSGLTFANPTVANPKASVQVSGGSDGNIYLVTMQINTTKGDRLQLSVYIKVMKGVN